uniref:ATP synthase F0 subunit 8 n=1 Tax=Curculionoidea sp. 1 KM-2015 TaxID=1903762 RepID=A0A343A5I6_9CUCU|nr:ATP synthase F0 subunit 8 [Curculionoidea sp. 1 KM-2015]
MPQMSPLQWTPLYLYFTMLFILIMMINYYLQKNSSIKTQTNLKKTMINWKW